MTKPAEPRPSASVILLRPNRAETQGFEIFLLKRQGGSSFMPGRFVFPGGGLEPSDGPGEQGLRRCAIRELWEEAGVVLVQGKPGQSLDPEMVEAGRTRLEAGREGLDQVLAGMGLAPGFDLLIPFARWITPRARPKRFDTTFYLARLPQGQKAAADHKETTEGVWLTPAQALEENQSGRVGLAAPQVRIMGELSTYKSLEELLRNAAAQGELNPVRPVLWADRDQRIIFLPWDADHAVGRPESPVRPCAARECTRLVHDQGRWRPHASRRGKEARN